MKSISNIHKITSIVRVATVGMGLLAANPALAVEAGPGAGTAAGTANITATAANTCAIGLIKRYGFHEAGVNVSQSGSSWVEGTTANFKADAGTQVISWSNLFDAATAKLNISDSNYNLANLYDTTAGRKLANVSFPAYCNYGNTRVALKSTNGGMRLASAPPIAPGSQFNNAIAYRAVASWGRRATTTALPGDNESTYVNSGTNLLGVSGGRPGNVFGTTTGVAAGTWTANGTSVAARNATLSVRIAPNAGMVVTGNGPGVLSTTNTLPFLAGTYSDTLMVRIGAGF